LAAQRTALQAQTGPKRWKPWCIRCAAHKGLEYSSCVEPNGALIADSLGKDDRTRGTRATLNHN